MKDTRFTELVNLYIDRQISSDEAAELELEIQSNPRRRQAYLEYCRMHRATKLVYESFRAHAEQGEGTPARQPATIARLESRRRQRRARWVYGTGLAAAACFALVLGRIDLNSAAGNNAPAELSAAMTPPPAAPAVAVAPPANPSPANATTAVETRAGFASLRSSVFAEADYAAVLATVRQEEQRLLGLTESQARRVSLFEDGVFDDRQVLRVPNGFQPRRSRPTTELTAFQFQR